MEIMLDTDILIDVMRGRLELLPEHSYSISIITLYEVIRGMKRPRTAKYLLESRFSVYPLTNEIILKASEIYRALKARGAPIGEADLLIGATAAVTHLPLWTKNKRHFERLEEFGLELWG